MVFNELDGAEAKEILLQRFSSHLNSIPWLQRHLTLPRVRMRLSITFEMYADQPTPDIQTIADDFTIRTDHGETLPFKPHLYEEEETIDASPLTGDPPDQIREEHSLPVPTPVRNKTLRVTEDSFIEHADLIPGVTIDRIRSDTPSPTRGSTQITQDFGPRLQRSEPALPFKNRDRDHKQVPLQVPRKP